MTEVNPTLSVTTLSINRILSPFTKQILIEWIYAERNTSFKKYVKTKKKKYVKTKIIQRYVLCRVYKRARMAKLIPIKIDQKTNIFVTESYDII